MIKKRGECERDFKRVGGDGEEFHKKHILDVCIHKISEKDIKNLNRMCVPSYIMKIFDFAIIFVEMLWKGGRGHLFLFQ